MKEFTYVALRQKTELKEAAAAWFHDKWEVPQEAYLECMEAYLNHETEYGISAEKTGALQVVWV